MTKPAFQTELSDGSYLVQGVTFNVGDVLELTKKEQAVIDRLSSLVRSLGALRSQATLATAKDSDSLDRKNQESLLLCEEIQLQIPVVRTELIHMLGIRLGGFLPLEFNTEEGTVTVGATKQVTNITNQQVYNALGGPATMEPLLVALGAVAEVDINQLTTSSVISRTTAVKLRTPGNWEPTCGVVEADDIQECPETSVANQALRGIKDSKFSDNFHIAFLFGRKSTVVMNLGAQLTDQPYECMVADLDVETVVVIASWPESQTSMSVASVSTKSATAVVWDEDTLGGLSPVTTELHPTIGMFFPELPESGEGEPASE